MTSTVNQVIEQLKTLTLMETTELISQIETVFGVDASAAAMPQMSVGAAQGQPNADNGAKDDTKPEPEKSTFKIKLVSIDSNPKNNVKLYKAIRNITSVGITESKEFVKKLPKVLKEDATKEEVEEITQTMEEIGAKISTD